MTFKDLGLVEPILKALETEGYKTPTPIQEQAIPFILEGKDLLGCAQTGTGKTAAFALPLIQRLLKKENVNASRGQIRVLVLTPTRELAMQIRDNFRKYAINTDLKCSVVFGGINQRSQVEVLKKGVDILVATPGRLLDLINQRYVKLNGLEIVVLDEADTMLDMGFINDVKKIISNAPENRQTLLFSATMNDQINILAKSFLKDSVSVRINPVETTVEKINQSLYFVDRNNKHRLLIEILNGPDMKSALVFSRTKHGANKLAEILYKNGIEAEVIHGNKSQGARVQALNNFKNGKSKVLVATDIAARGIDIIELSHVINYEMPEQAEVYVHRIGRTGRAGLNGTAISFCCIDEKDLLHDVQRLIKQIIPVVENHEYPMIQLVKTPKPQTFTNRSKPNFGTNHGSPKTKFTPQNSANKPAYGNNRKQNKAFSKNRRAN